MISSQLFHLQIGKLRFKEVNGLRVCILQDIPKFSLTQQLTLLPDSPALKPPSECCTDPAPAPSRLLEQYK